MALPPEPVVELLAEAERVFVGEVLSIEREGPAPSNPKVERGISDARTKARGQTVRVRVTRNLRGKGPSELVLDKPEGAYLLRVGVSGVFFVRGREILGRYGPDTHALTKVEQALSKP